MVNEKEETLNAICSLIIQGWKVRFFETMEFFKIECFIKNSVLIELLWSIVCK